MEHYIGIKKNDRLCLDNVRMLVTTELCNPTFKN